MLVGRFMCSIDGVHASRIWTLGAFVGFEPRKFQALPEVEDDSYAAIADGVPYQGRSQQCRESAVRI